VYPDNRDPGPPSPTEVQLTRIDVPFVELVAFFVKSSFALALAFLLTSWLWVIVGTGVGGLALGLMVVAGVPGWFAPPPAAPEVAPPSIVVVQAPAVEVPVVEVPVVEVPVVLGDAAPVDEAAAPNADANRSATEAAQLAELERMRRERASRGTR
jgi:hypothetical protein